MALYLIGSMINHSCESPNVEKVVNASSTAIWVAKKKIAKNEELFMEYVPPQTHRPELLEQSYGFMCSGTCESCNEEEEEERGGDKKGDDEQSALQ